MWSSNITRETQIVIYPLTHCLGLSVLAVWGYTMRGFLPKVTRFFDHMVLQGHVNNFSCCIYILPQGVWSPNLAKW